MIHDAVVAVVLVLRFADDGAFLFLLLFSRAVFVGVGLLYC